MQCLIQLLIRQNHIPDSKYSYLDLANTTTRPRRIRPSTLSIQWSHLETTSFWAFKWCFLATFELLGSWARIYWGILPKFHGSPHRWNLSAIRVNAHKGETLKLDNQQKSNQMTWRQAIRWNIRKILGLIVKVSMMRAILKIRHVIAHHSVRLKSQFLNQIVTTYIEDLKPSRWDSKS